MHQENDQPGSAPINSVIDRSTAEDARVERKVEELLERESFKRRTKEIISDYVDSVPFMKKVQEYASDEVQKSYSSERYEEFQDAVTKIIHNELAGDEARKKLDTHLENKVSAVLDARGWKKKTFWWPLVIAGVTALIGIGTLIIGINALSAAKEANRISGKNLTTQR